MTPEIHNNDNDNEIEKALQKIYSDEEDYEEDEDDEEEIILDFTNIVLTQENKQLFVQPIKFKKFLGWRQLTPSELVNLTIKRSNESFFELNGKSVFYEFLNDFIPE